MIAIPSFVIIIILSLVLLLSAIVESSNAIGQVRAGTKEQIPLATAVDKVTTDLQEQDVEKIIEIHTECFWVVLGNAEHSGKCSAHVIRLIVTFIERSEAREDLGNE